MNKTVCAAAPRAGRGPWIASILLAVTLSAGAGGLAWSAPPVPGALNRPALQVARPAQAVLLAVARAGQRLVAAGERGLVITSDDGGRQWSQSQVPVSVTLTRLRFVDEREGWAVGNMGVVLHTRDGGATWQRVLDGIGAASLALEAARAAAQPIDEAQRMVDEGADKPWLDVAPGPDGSVLVVGGYGLALGSRDAGQSWQPPLQELPNPEGFSYYGLAQRGEERFLYGEQGLLLHSPAATAAFVAAQSPSTGSLFNAVALREGPLLLLGLRGKVFRSAQSGAPWTEVQTPVDASLLAGLQLADGRVVLVGAAGQVLVSADQGQTFRPVALGLRFPFTDLAQAPDGALLLVGMRGLLRVELAALSEAARNDNKPKMKTAP